jgi:integrase
MLTDATIKNLAKPDKRTEYVDSGSKGAVRGLRIIVQPSGEKSWALRYRFGGQNRKLTLGSYPEITLSLARRKAEKARGELAGGKDPAAAKTAARAALKAEREAEADRVDTIARSFVERYVKRHVGDGWGHETERLLKVEIIPVIGDKRIGDVRKRDVLDLLDGVVDRGSPITANRTLAVLRRLFNWAIERGIIESSPVERIKPPAAEQTRDRVLSDEEIRLAWGAFERIGWPFGEIDKLLLLTGARRDEIAGARWHEIDLDARTWTIGKERSKNGVEHTIPLSDKAIEIVKALPRMGGKNGLIFSTTGETSVSGFAKARTAIDKAILEALRAEAQERGEDPEKVAPPPHWTIHDLRRTAASGMAGIGIAPHVVEAVLNHRSGTIKGVAAIYNRYSYASEKRAALDAWARRLDGIVNEETEAKVVAFVRK